MSHPFSHEMTSIVQKDLIVGYFISIKQPFDKVKNNFLTFYLFRKIWTMHSCTCHNSFRWACWIHCWLCFGHHLKCKWIFNGARQLWYFHFRESDAYVQLYIDRLTSTKFRFDLSRLGWSSYVHYIQRPKELEIHQASCFTF